MERADILLTKMEIADLTGKTKRTIERMAKKEAWPATEETGNGPGGKVTKHPLAGLPPAIQNRYLEKYPLYNKEGAEAQRHKGTELKEEVELLPVPIKRNSVVSLRDILPAPTDTQTPTDAWQNLPEASRNKSYDILLIVNRVRELLARTPHNEKTPALKAYAASINYDHRSLYRYCKRANKALVAAQKTGDDTIMAQILALAPKYGRNKDRVTAFDKNAVIYAFTLFATQQQKNMSDVYHQTVSMAAEKNWQIGTYASLCNYLKKLDNATATLAREGKKVFEADCLLKILRDYDKIEPNFMWCGDHHIFDVFVKLPDGKGGWSYKRPWLTSWLDMRSRALMGWCISFAPNSRTIAMALAHAIADKNDPAFPQCGIPASVYIDNGKDYRAKYLNGEEIEIGSIDYPDIIERFAALGIDPFYIDLEFDPEQNAWVKKHGDKLLQVKGVRVGGVYARLNIHQRYATAYHPWAKPIERFHRTIVQSFSRDLPGWCGSGHEQRPEKLTFELKSGRTILTIDEFCERFYGWVVNKYHKTEHRGHGMDGRTPDEVFTSLLPTPQICEPALLDFALLKKESVKIHNWGFNLNGRQFELDLPVNLSGGHMLNILIGAWATIFYDYDYKTIRVYKDDKYCCNARALNRASFTTPNDPVMVDKLKLAAYQKRVATGTIRMIQEHPVVQEGMSEAAALLELTQGSGLGDTGISGQGSGVSRTPETDNWQDDIIPITRDDRYRMISQKLACGRTLSQADIDFKADFEQSQEYKDSAQLYGADFEYQQYLYGGK